MSGIVLCCLFLAVTSVASQGFQFLDLDEHDVCRRFWGAEWTCRMSTDCPEVGRNSRPVICSFQGRNPVVCCPPGNQRRPPPRRFSPAAQACTRYRETCRINSKLRRTEPFWRPYRWRRQVDPEEQRPSIVGGDYAAPRSRPYMALVGYGEANSIEWNCGGSLISEKFVMTAAHCVVTKNQGPARWVRLGELDVSRDDEDSRPETVAVVSGSTHPDYKEPAIYNDIGLLQLEREIVFSPWIRPICLQTALDIPATRATAAGWGRTDFVGETSPELMEVELTLIGEKECSAQAGQGAGLRLPNGIQFGTMICAGERRGGKDTCAGDSGGPLVIRDPFSCMHTQIGITSFGRQCGLPNSPGVYSRVSAFIPWIESIVWP